MSKIVLLTGASGFVALHVLDALLKKNYHVIGTVRSKGKADTITKEFKNEYPEANLDFEIVRDIGAQNAFDEVFQRHPKITDVIHTASPFSYGLNQDLKDAYLTPALEGTKNILEATQKFGKDVKHVVITSSYVSVLHYDKRGDRSFVHTEETWNPIVWEDVNDEYTAYFASKKLSEQFAHKFASDNKPKWSLTAVNPPFIFGPQKFDSALQNSSLNTSADFLNQLLRSDPKNTNLFEGASGPSADVRDVARLHVLAIENDDLSGKRLLPYPFNFTFQSLLDILHNEFPELNGKIAKGKPEETEEQLSREIWAVDTSETSKITGINDWIPLEKTVKDAASQILKYRKSKPSQ
ncbi:putative secreted protein [Wickerhamomyces ciferrii]|uniref:Secreted protein n=1 Tax=Wickerhamomyces ciferrii (strain ATCC 14091 / BCRC 22168 / CBS 111 / JCM 3599 / NBRC 0793 / NRRL Y-1031 F-60-10) TaxID=1206466 RepID=K0KGX3_WICCF|nr:uncharacterized protein BN7_3999 [Wickerhamomyces ciferrii]CCH44435.1 putative secreted protein [Wickerhamomyces ciferrii]